MSDLPLMPCLEANDGPAPRVLGGFAYLGIPKTAAEFATYLASYDFGTVEPDQVVLHNTANPDASWASLDNNTSTNWDRDEAGLSLTAIRNKRQKQLDAIRNYYVSLGWDAGPHLFIDDRWIWLFTPLADVGIHAKEGNSYTVAGRLHYTIGIEVVGWYGKVVWPFAIQTMVRSAVQSLQKRLGTFEIVYRQAPAHHPAAHQGSIAFHYDYNKPQCPGAKITPGWAIPVLKAQPTLPPPRTPVLYRAIAPMYISETPSPFGPVALGGQAVVYQGDTVVIDEVRSDGWCHTQDGVGFLPIGGLEMYPITTREESGS